MRHVWIILIIIGSISILIIGTLLISRVFLPGGAGCTRDCQRVCDPIEECCIDECVPGSCGWLSVRKDLSDYYSDGFVLLNYSRVNWPLCEGDLENYEIQN